MLCWVTALGQRAHELCPDLTVNRKLNRVVFADSIFMDVNHKGSMKNPLLYNRCKTPHN